MDILKYLANKKSNNFIHISLQHLRNLSFFYLKFETTFFINMYNLISLLLRIKSFVFSVSAVSYN